MGKTKRDWKGINYPAITDHLASFELDAYFHLSCDDLARARAKRGDHNRLGYALQLTLLRWLGHVPGASLGQAPAAAVVHLAEQLGILDPDVLGRYGERETTIRDHEREIRETYGFHRFTQERSEMLRAELKDLAWSTGPSRESLFNEAVSRLRLRLVVLPGKSTLQDLVADVHQRDETRLEAAISGVLTLEQRQSLDRLIGMGGESTACFQSLRHSRPRGHGIEQVHRALDRVAEVAALRLDDVELSSVPPRRMAELARSGMSRKAAVLRRHKSAARYAMLAATVIHLRQRTVDDALGVLCQWIDKLISQPFRRASDKAFAANREEIQRATSTTVAAGEATDCSLLEHVNVQTGEITPPAADGGAHVLQAILDTAAGPAPQRAEDREVLKRLVLHDNEALWKTMLQRYDRVRELLPRALETVAFRAVPGSESVLAALAGLSELLAHGEATREQISHSLVAGVWRQRVLEAPHLAPGMADLPAYALCLVTQLPGLLRKHMIFAEHSLRWGNPQVNVLDGEEWEQLKGGALSSLQLFEDADEQLAQERQAFDEQLEEFRAQFPGSHQVTIGDDGSLMFHEVAAVARRRDGLQVEIESVMKPVDLSVLLLEVLTRVKARSAFTSRGNASMRLSDMEMTAAALLVARGVNVPNSFVTGPHLALARDRIAHFEQYYFHDAALRELNRLLIDHQARIDLARQWGGGHVASVADARFNLDQPAASSRTKTSSKVVTWITLINDQAAGLAGKIIVDSPRQSLQVLDVVYERDGGAPQNIVADASDNTDLVFGLLTLGGFTYTPTHQYLPDKTLCRIAPGAHHGALESATRGQVNLERIKRHWPHILRVIGSLHLGKITTTELRRILMANGHLNPLARAIADYGSIIRSRHLMRLASDPSFRHTTQTQTQLHEKRQKLAAKIRHGKAEAGDRYQPGLEMHFGALGLVVNVVTLYNTLCMDEALTNLRARGIEPSHEDISSLSPFVWKHITFHGRYVFQRPPRAQRSLIAEAGTGPDAPPPTDHE